MTRENIRFDSKLKQYSCHANAPNIWEHRSFFQRKEDRIDTWARVLLKKSRDDDGQKKRMIEQ